MRLFRAAIASAVTLTTLVIVAPTAATAAPPAAPYTVVTVNGGSGNFPLWSGSRLMDESNSTISLVAHPESGVLMQVQSPWGLWRAELHPPIGTVFTPGTRYDTRDFPDEQYAGFSLTGEARACSGGQSGWIEISQLDRSPTGALTAFAATYRVACDDAEEPMTGELRWRSSVGFSAASQTTRELDFEHVIAGQIGPEQSVTITADGSLPLRLGRPVVRGPHPDSFQISADGCANTTLAYGQTCTIRVRPTPSRVGTRDARLVIPDADGAAQRELTLTVRATMSLTGFYSPTEPRRLLDTRSGLGGTAGPVRDHQTVDLRVTGSENVPADGVSAVVLNVTATGATKPGYVTVYPSGQSRPTASNLNLAVGGTAANSVTVGVGADGGVRLHHRGGSTHLVVDMVGFYIGAPDTISSGPYGRGTFFTTENQRILDTRHPWYGGPLPGGGSVTVPVDYGTSDVNGSIRALAVNVTAVSAGATGHLTAWSGCCVPPTTSTLNFTRGRTVPNMAIVPVSPCPAELPCDGLPSIQIRNGSAGATHVLVDIFGLYAETSIGPGLRFRPLPPTRIVDSRIAQGVPDAIGDGSTARVEAPGSVTTPVTRALALNVTAVSPTQSTYLTVWPDLAGVDRPVVSMLNPVKGETVPNTTITRIGESGAFNVYNYAGRTHLVVDVAGTFEFKPELGRAAGDGRHGVSWPRSVAVPSDGGGYRR